MHPSRRTLDLSLLATSLVTLAVIAACAGSKPIDVSEGDDDDDDDGVVTFSESFAALQEENCGSSGCHLAPATVAGNLILPNLAGAVTMTNAYVNITAGGDEGPAVTAGNPDGSLLLQKGLGQLGHTGGQQWTASDDTYETIEEWIDAGATY